jgi:lipoprotein-releasing system ATP-binding protein
MLELKDVCKQYSSPDQEEPVAVLKGITLGVDTGTSMAVVGPSGCGKSTLLNMMGGLDRPSQGQVLMDGQDLAALGDTELAQVRNRAIGFVFQQHHLLPQCTVLENVLVPTLAYQGKSPREHQQRAGALLKEVGLEAFVSYRPGQLSGGQRQRVAVARALINGPKLLLADEPTGSLDQETAERIGQLLLAVQQAEGVALVVVTHSTALAQQMDQVNELNQGLLQTGGD